MTNRHLKRKMNILIEGDRLEPCKNMDLEYYLLECGNNLVCENYENSGELQNHIVYGVEIVKLLGGKPSESISFNDITYCKNTALGIINLLARNTVTPVGLPYVLDNIIGV